MSFWKEKRVFVTGHTGFKGSWLSFWLSEMGAEVCGFALEPDTNPSLFSDLGIERRVKSIIADVRNLDDLQCAIVDFQPQIIFHLAAQPLVRRSYREPVETYSTNLMGTVNVLESIRNCDSVRAAVMITTDKVYENREQGEGYREVDRLGGFDPYSNSKACAELAISSYRDSFFRNTQKLVASARAGNVIGGGDWSEDRLIPDVFRSLIFGDELLIRNPNSVRPWQHVMEPLSGYMMLAEKLYNGEEEFAAAWNFGPDEEDAQSVGVILDILSSQWDGKVTWEIAGGDHPHETGVLKLDSAKAREKLNWNPKLRLIDALSLTGEWYRAFKSEENLVEKMRAQVEFYITK